MMTSSNFFHQNWNVSEFSELVEKCLLRFDCDEDGGLSKHEIVSLTSELFCDDNGKPYSLPTQLIPNIFRCFDANKDGIIDYEELKAMWEQFVTPLVKPCCAIVIIDVQNDFIDGSLAVRTAPAAEEGKEVIPVINNLLESVQFQHAFYSYDWHPENHISFLDNLHLYELDENCDTPPDEIQLYDIVTFKGPPRIQQKLWPIHCIQDSWGSELHPDLLVPDGALFTYKGTSPNIDSYSAFWDNQKASATSLADDLKSRNVTDVFVCGLVYDFCVGSTALHSLELGFKTTLIEDACRCLTVSGRESMREQLISKNAAVVSSSQVAGMVEGRDRKPELAMTLLQGIMNSS